jgi:DNA ligase-4
MRFLFSYLSDLLEDLLDVERQYLQTLDKEYRKSSIHRVFISWFRCHRERIDNLSIDSSVALLSCLFPERRTDRVYLMKDVKLSRILGQALGLSSERIQLLKKWQEAQQGDLGDCVERVQRMAEFPAYPEEHQVSIEEIDQALSTLASWVRFSSSSVQARGSDQTIRDPLRILKPIFHRLSSRNAKWLIRMILKCYLPVLVPENMVLSNFHFLLPDLLRFQSSYTDAMILLKGCPNKLPSRPVTEVFDRLRAEAAQYLRPKVGVKVGRACFFKARVRIGPRSCTEFC